MMRIISWILKHCFTSFEEVFVRRLFLLSLQKKNLQLKKGSDQYTAFRAGHLLMGKLLNTMPEAEALEIARKHIKDEIPDGLVEERSIIHLCGEEIISAATKCLPDEIIELAKKWQTASVDEQIEIARTLFFAFRSQDQESKGEFLTMKVASRSINDMFSRHEQDRLGYLPGLYGKWDPKTSPAHCQGKTQMLIAFARLAGIEALVVHPVIHAKEKVKKTINELRRIILVDLEERGLKEGSKDFAESMSASILEDRIKEREALVFHVAVIFKLKDGRWILIDPHGLSWGIIPENWEFEKNYTILKKYSKVLPGLTMMTGNENIGDDVTCSKFKLALDLIERSRKMEKKMREVDNAISLIDILAESEDLDLLLRLDAEEKGNEPFDLSLADRRKYVAMMILFGGPEKIMSMSFLFDPNAFKKAIDGWLTFYHCSAMNLFLNKESDEGKLIHPICEVSADPAWAIAIAAINSASFFVGIRGEEMDEFFLRNSFDQTSFFNALYSRDPSIGVAAEGTLKSLKYLHPLCIKRLRQIGREGDQHV